MITERKLYKGEDFAVLIPTKDRPDKMRNLLNSLVSQTVQCGRIIVVASGGNIQDLVLSFSDQLPVEYFHTETGGQIHQRNVAISKLDSRSPLVISFDDDIVLSSDAFSSMLSFWNNCEPETAGVSFNIENNPPYSHSWIKAFIGMSSKKQGSVLSSGYNVATSPVTSDLRAQWLCGGATVWKQNILKEFINREVKSRWAICEDVIFSYPISKIFPLYICAESRVRHEHVYDHTTKKKYQYYGKTATLWRFHFVESHAELSRMFFLWMSLGQIAARCITGVVLFRISDIQYALGQIQGIAIGLSALIRGTELASVLNEDE